MRKILCLAIALTLSGFAYGVTLNTINGPQPGAVVTANAVTDSMMASMGLANADIVSDYNIWINPARISAISGKAGYAEIWQGNAWGGSVVKLPIGKLGIFLGRPYRGVGGFIGSRVGTANDVDITNVDGFASNGVLASINAAWAITGCPANMDNLAICVPNNDFDVIYGLSLPLINVGARLSYAANSAKVTYPFNSTPAANSDGTISNDRKSTDIQMAVGAMLKKIGPLETLEGALTVSNPMVTNTLSEESRQTAVTTTKNLTATTELKGKAGVNMNLLVRGILSLWGSQLVTSLSQDMIDNSSEMTYLIDCDADATKEGNSVAKWDDKTMGTAIRASLHTKPSDNLKVIYLAGIMSIARENKYTFTDNLLPTDDFTPQGVSQKDTRKESQAGILVGVGLEHQTFKMIKTRFGVNRTIMQSQSVSVADQTGADSNGDNIYDTYTGGTREDSQTTQGATTVSAGVSIAAAKDVTVNLQIVTGATAAFMDNIARATVKWGF